MAEKPKIRCTRCHQPGHTRRSKNCPGRIASGTAAPVFEAFDDIPSPPEDPLALAEWCCRVQAICLEETIRGRGNPDLSREVRELSAGIAKLIPADILSKAKRKITEATSPKRATKQRRGPTPQRIANTDAGDHRAERGSPLRQ